MPKTPETDPNDGPGFITDKQAEKLGLTAETAQQVIEDADQVYRRVSRAPHSSRDALVKWANAKWGDGAVDRLNAAIAYLRAIEKLIGI